jgi:hypothetical protein
MVAGAIAGNISAEATTPTGNSFSEAMRAVTLCIHQPFSAMAFLLTVGTYFSDHSLPCQRRYLPPRYLSDGYRTLWLVYSGVQANNRINISCRKADADDGQRRIDSRRWRTPSSANGSARPV